MKEKINILAISNGNTSGVAFFRIMSPFKYLQKKYPDDYNILVLASDQIDLTAPNLYNIDIVHFHSNISNNKPLMDKLYDMQKKGCKLVQDLDDYFDVPLTNPFAEQYNRTLTKPIISNLTKVDYITTTTKLFATELKKYTKKKIKVFPNVIDYSLDQYKYYPSESNKLRIGVICGSSHQYDIELLKDMVSQLSKYQDKIQWVVCGFDTRGVTHPEFSAWNIFEQVFTDDYKIISKEYKDYLLTFNEQPYPNIDNQPYKRCWARDINSYGELYNEIDILLAPLVNDKFNCMKSELKVVEAGHFGKVFIGSAIGIYKEVITNGFDGLLVNPWDNLTGWSKQISRILDNPDIYYILQSNLFNTCKNKYSIDKWTDKRNEFYKSITNK